MASLLLDTNGAAFGSPGPATLECTLPLSISKRATGSVQVATWQRFPWTPRLASCWLWRPPRVPENVSNAQLFPYHSSLCLFRSPFGSAACGREDREAARSGGGSRLPGTRVVHCCCGIAQVAIPAALRPAGCSKPGKTGVSGARYAVATASTLAASAVNELHHTGCQPSLVHSPVWKARPASALGT